MRTMKERDVGGCRIYILDLEKVVQKGEFPNRSKITTAVFDKVKQNGAVMVFGIGERTLIMRLNDTAVQRGWSADALAKKVSGSMVDFVESGGGHAKAGAIRVKEGFVNSVVEEMIRIIGG
jgi:RecJ-like exonuclease